jgi:endonuclease YncB( thermonuclease family)
MIENGCAWFYRRYKNTLDIDDQVMYDQAEIFAIENKKGLFSNQEAEAPWDWRKKN